MSLNYDLVGKTYDSYEYRVTSVKIAEYARALGEVDRRYSGESGHEQVAPPTFAAAFTLIQANEAALHDRELGTHERFVHGSQTYQYGDRTLRPGDVLECQPRLSAIQAKGANEFLEIEVTCRFTDTNALAVRSRCLLIFLGS